MSLSVREVVGEGGSPIVARLGRQELVAHHLLVRTPVRVEGIEEVIDIHAQRQHLRRGSLAVDVDVLSKLEVELMVPRHLRAAAFRILALAVLQIVALLDVSPEVIALHVGGIDLLVAEAVGEGAVVLEIPGVELFAACRHINQVGRRIGIIVYVRGEGVAVARVAVGTEVTTLAAVILQAASGLSESAFGNNVGSRDEQAVRLNISGIAQWMLLRYLLYAEDTWSPLPSV